MNQSFSPKKTFFSALLLMCVTLVFSQGNPVVKEITLLPGEVLYDTIYSYAQTPRAIYPQAPEFTFQASPPAANQSAIQITFDPGVTGHQTILVEYYVPAIFPPIAPAYITYEIDILPSIVEASDDFVKKTSDTLIIHPLTNDYSNLNSLSLVSINQVLNGTATFQGDSITYIGDADQDIILYTVKDSIGTADQGIVYLLHEDLNFSGSDTLSLVITNLSKQLLILPNDDFVVLQGAANGNLVLLAGQAVQYVPDFDFIGFEFLSFEDGNGNTRCFDIRVVDAQKDPGFVKDDAFYTPVSTLIEFNVLDNDLNSTGGVITYFSPQLTHLGNGVFTYDPPTGFKGTKSFTYKVNYGFKTETGSIAVNVGNFDPFKDLVYEFDVLQGKDFLIDYEVPIEGYSFNLLNQPYHGSAQVFVVDDTITTACATSFGKVGIHYLPEADYTGYDEFDIEYCINNSQCKIYKLRFNVTSPLIDSLCNCIDDCVWAGDANGDGRISVTDLMSIGRFMGSGGDARTVEDQGIWNGDSAPDWLEVQPNGKNAKHIDADADGVITASDVDALANNYGGIHSLVPKEILTIKDYPFYLIPHSTEVDSGDLLVIDIAIGNANYPVKDIHGLAFGLNLNPDFVDSSSLELVFFNDTWFTHQSTSLELVVHKSEGKVDAGFTRTTGLGVSGYGIIGQLSFIVEEDATGIQSSELLESIKQYIYLRDGIMEDGYGRKYALPDAHAEVLLHLSKKEDAKDANDIVIFPNPAQEKVRIHSNNAGSIHAIAVYDAMGRLYLHQEIGGLKHTDVDCSTYPEGMYIFQINTAAGTQSRKVQIAR